MEFLTKFSPLEAAPGLIYLGDHSNEYKQLIYASQVYGTFFTIYGTFNTAPGRDQNHRLITEVAFELINYKGLLDIGLKKISFEKAINCFHVQLEAMAPKNDIVLKNVEVLSSEKLYFLRHLDPISMADKKNVHDDEFYYRDGSYIAPKIPHHKLEAEDVPKIIACINSTEEQEVINAPGARCMMSELKVLI